MNDIGAGAVPLGGAQRLQLQQTDVWPLVGVDVIAESIPFMPSEFTVRIIDVQHGRAVLLPFDRQGLRKLRNAITAELDELSQPTQQEDERNGIN